jgi:FMN phosphatase YigB (HAD superfamily)
MDPRPAPPTHRLVFLVDVDNTLLDNDAVIDDLRQHLVSTFGRQCQTEYWRIFEQLRRDLGYADYLGALQRYRIEYPRDPHLLAVSSFLIDYHFANRLYPGSLDALEHLAAFGRTVILTDGDVVFQPRKVERAGLFDAVEGNVLIYIHKERELDDVERRYPAEHYVIVDDKLRILDAIKHGWDSRVTTVFLRQGHYATDADSLESYSPADLALDAIGELVDALIDANALPNRWW